MSEVIMGSTDEHVFNIKDDETSAKLVLEYNLDGSLSMYIMIGHGHSQRDVVFHELDKHQLKDRLQEIIAFL